MSESLAAAGETPKPPSSFWARTSQRAVFFPTRFPAARSARMPKPV